MYTEKATVNCRRCYQLASGIVRSNPAKDMQTQTLAGNDQVYAARNTVMDALDSMLRFCARTDRGSSWTTFAPSSTSVEMQKALGRCVTCDFEAPYIALSIKESGEVYDPEKTNNLLETRRISGASMTHEALRKGINEDMQPVLKKVDSLMEKLYKDPSKLFEKTLDQKALDQNEKK